MKTAERRKAIAIKLLSEKEAVSGSVLSEHFGVSRQIIVKDIMFLKASGYDILSTHNGYVMQKSPLKELVIKVHHTTQETENELNLIVDQGGTVVDVFVWHKVYGRIHAELNISSRNDVKKFIEGVRTGKSSELMNVTGGYHYHTVSAKNEEILNKIYENLSKAGYIVPEI